MVVGHLAPVNASAEAVIAQERRAYAVCEGVTMKTIKFRISGSFLAAWIGSLLVAGSAFGADEALIAAAKKEGELTWYTTQIINQFGRPAAEAFQKKYGIRVNAVRG